MRRRPARIGAPKREETVTPYPAIVNFYADFKETPRGIAGGLRKVLKALEEVYGDAPGEARFGGRLPRHIMEELVDSLRTRYGYNHYALTPRQVAAGPILAEMNENPRLLSYSRPSYFQGVPNHAWNIRFSPATSTATTADLECKLSIMHVPKRCLRRFNSLINELFQTAAVGEAVMARAELYVLPRAWAAARWWFISSDYGFAAMGPPLEHMARESWSAISHTEDFLPPVTWATLLSPRHLQKLGGRDAIVAEIGSISDEVIRTALLCRPLPNGRLRITVGNLAKFGQWLSSESDLSMHHENAAAWLNWRLAQSELLVWQSPDLGRQLVTPARIPDLAAEPAETPDTSETHAQAAKLLESYMARLWANPPACIAHVAAPPTPQTKRALARSHGPLHTAFAISPGGVKKAFPIWDRRSKGDSQMLDPVLVGGPTRAAAVFVFDQQLHGWDAEFSDRRVPNSKPVELRYCPSCGHNKFFATAIFEYSGDDEDLIEPDHLARVQDFFQWFQLRTRCESCGRTETLIDAECA